MTIEVTRLPVGRGGYERMPDEASGNVELSLMAVGLLTRLLKDGARYNSIDAIADAYSPPVPEGRTRQKQGFGRDAYRFAAKELEAVGHLARTRVIVNGAPTHLIEVFAEPFGGNVRSVPTTLVTSSSGPAETPRNARSRPTTLVTSSEPPAETVHKPRSRPTTLVTSFLYTDCSPDVQTSSPYPLNAHDQGCEPCEEGGGGGESTSERQRQADALVAALPIDIQTIDRPRQRKLNAGIVAALASGWTDADLKQELQREMGNARSPVGVWLSRLKPENLGPPRRLTAVPEPRKPAPKCHWCDEGGRWYRSNGDDLGTKCTHPTEAPAGHPEHHAKTKETAA